MCCDKRYIYTSDLIFKTAYSDWTTTNNPIDITALVSGDFIHDNPIQISCGTADTNGHGDVIGIQLFEKETGTMQKKDLRVWIFNTVPAGAIAMNAARAWTNADSLKIAGYIDIVTADYTDTSATGALVSKDLRTGTTKGNQVIPFNTVESSTTIYMVVEARASVQFDNNDAIRIRLNIARR